MAACGKRANLRRAAVTAFIVGPILTLINQWNAVVMLAGGQTPPRIALLQIALTFAVPFCVSLSSSALSDVGRTATRI